LIAEDAPDVAEIVAFGARMTWPDCQVTVASSGAEALERFGAEPPDLVVLDVSMPAPDGFEVCRRIRETSLVPILMLTVHDATLDKVRALDLGADDYLTKPFDHLELLARLRALVRRSSGTHATPTDTFTAGDLTIDFASHEVRIGGTPIALTSTEYRLLEALARHALCQIPEARQRDDPRAARDVASRVRHDAPDFTAPKPRSGARAQLRDERWPLAAVRCASSNGCVRTGTPRSLSTSEASLTLRSPVLRRPSTRSSESWCGHNTLVVARLMAGEAAAWRSASGSTAAAHQRRDKSVQPSHSFRSHAWGNSAV
jgi:DNA-binding response OmpR family regulator